MRAVTAEALAAVTESHTGINLGIDDPTSRWCAAIAATHLLWRDGPLEDVHAGVGKPGGISDADMMRANVITTRHVAGALAGDGCDWRRLATELTDAGRPIGEVALSEFVGAVNVDGLRRHALAEARRLDALVTAPEHLSAEALAWCVDDARLADVDRRAVKRRWQAAGRPRWAPASWSEGADPPRPAG